MDISQKIHFLSNFKGLSANKLAELSGVSRATIGKIIRGESSPSLANLEKIAAGLDIPLAHILLDRDVNFDQLKRDHAAMWAYLEQAEKLEGMKQ